MKIILTFLNVITFCIIIAISSCKKDNPLPVKPSTSNCVITNETNNLGGHSWLYEYDADGNPLKITKLYPNGTPESTIDIDYSSIAWRSGRNGHNVVEVTRYDANLFAKKLPFMARVSIEIDGITQVDYMQYFFFYDSKLRLNKVGQQTIYVGDKEYDLNIFYNDKDNVTALQYEWTTGENIVIPPITVTAYDENPTPYASIGIWKFLMRDFAWNNSDPEPILTALSSNNPLDLTVGPWTIKMSYKYNEQGFPVERVKVPAYENKQGTTSTQTFTYMCK